MHKPNIAFRPIVSNAGTTSYRLAKYLTTTFAPLLFANIHTVKKPINFAKVIQYLCFTNLTMASFDVKSLRYNPTRGSLFCLEKKLREFHFLHIKISELLSLTHTCLYQTTFTSQRNFYKQSDGLTNGLPHISDYRRHLHALF